MASPILWQNENATVTLIDVPSSIEAVQGTVQHPCFDHLESTRPPHVPYRNTEPKAAAANERLLQNNAGDRQLHCDYVKLLEQALDQVREHHKGDWCQPRSFTEQPSEKRKQPNNSLTALRTHEQSRQGNRGVILGQLSEEQFESQAVRLRVWRRKNGTLDPLAEPRAGVSIFNDTLISNDSQNRITIIVEDETSSETLYYHVPPKACFCLEDCRHSQAFRTAIREQAQQHDANWRFGLVLLDPPWPNRSVRRTHQTAGSTYHIASSLDSVYDLVLGMDCDMLMSENALIGIWITNKPAIREMVLGNGGLFESWGIRLLEEWVWLKVTTQGEPVTPLDAVWRKPYEVLLLGRKTKTKTLQAIEMDEQKPKRRALVSVPDIHSRKPCLKELLEPLLSGTNDHRALEVFARHLVGGWCSWGDECIKFNERRCWIPPEA